MKSLTLGAYQFSSDRNGAHFPEGEGALVVLSRS